MVVPYSYVIPAHVNPPPHPALTILRSFKLQTRVCPKEMMNNILVSKKFPMLWCKTKVIAMLKPVRDSSLPKSYRPITLLCHTYKLFERMIMNRINPITEHIIIKEQAGFRVVKSCKSQLLNLTQYNVVVVCHARSVVKLVKVPVVEVA